MSQNWASFGMSIAQTVLNGLHVLMVDEVFETVAAITTVQALAWKE